MSFLDSPIYDQAARNDLVNAIFSAMESPSRTRKNESNLHETDEIWLVRGYFLERVYSPWEWFCIVWWKPWSWGKQHKRKRWEYSRPVTRKVAQDVKEALGNRVEIGMINTMRTDE